MKEAIEKLIELMHQMNWFGMACYVAAILFLGTGLIFYYINDIGDYGIILITGLSLIVLLMGRVFNLLIKGITLIIKEHL